MSRYAKQGRLAKCGSMDSKYFGNIERFDKDISEKRTEKERFKIRLRQLLLENPDVIKQRYYAGIEVFKEIKEEFMI